MTKTELKKETTKKVLTFLTEEFGVYNVEREAQYFEFMIEHEGHELQFQLDTRNYELSSWDGMKLGEGNWTDQELSKQRSAVEAENVIGYEIRKLLAS